MAEPHNSSLTCATWLLLALLHSNHHLELGPNSRLSRLNGDKIGGNSVLIPLSSLQETHVREIKTLDSK